MADRHDEFKEIYHPVTGEPYGGLQIDQGKMRLWTSEPEQTWSATGYIRMVHMALFGMSFEPDRLTFAPAVPEGFERITLGPIPYREATLNLTLVGSGTTLASVKLDGQEQEPSIPATLTGEHDVELVMRL